MIDALLALPAHLRERLSRSLEVGLVSPPYAEAALSAALGRCAGLDGVCEELQRLDSLGIPPAAIALAIRAALQAAARVHGPELVWSGPEVPGLRARDTRQVYEELVAGAQRSLWISTYTYYDGPKAFRSLAERMHAAPTLEVILLLNIQRRHGDSAPAERIAVDFAKRLWERDWPGPAALQVFYDPRSLQPDAPAGVLHAKAIVADEQSAFITSANLTEAAFERNIEAGVLVRDHALAAGLALHFRTLIDRGLLLPLPR